MPTTTWRRLCLGLRRVPRRRRRTSLVLSPCWMVAAFCLVPSSAVETSYVAIISRFGSIISSSNRRYDYSRAHSRRAGVLGVRRSAFAGGAVAFHSLAAAGAASKDERARQLLGRRWRDIYYDNGAFVAKTPPTAATKPIRVLSKTTSSLALSSRTQYTISDSDCPPTDSSTLTSVVAKHVRMADRYLASKPMSRHTQAAFDECVQKIFTAPPPLVPLDAEEESPPQQQQQRLLILDSGCGIGRSSLQLGRMYPNHTVVGVDKSLARLARNKVVDFFPVTAASTAATMKGESLSTTTTTTGKANDPTKADLVQRAATNVWLVRAELVDFWQLLLEYLQQQQQQQQHSQVHQQQWQLQQHYMLYPNPYPKKSRLKHRWYAHSSFPILLRLLLHDDINTGSRNGNDNNNNNNSGLKKSKKKMVWRSNWKTYLCEVATAIQIVDDTLESSSSSSSLVPPVYNYARPYIDNNVRSETSPPSSRLTQLRPPVETGGQYKNHNNDMKGNVTATAMTHFEAKYMAEGEPCYELVLEVDFETGAQPTVPEK